MYLKFHKVHFRANSALLPTKSSLNTSPRAILVSHPHPHAFIFILYKRSGALTGLECFLVVLLGAAIS